MGSRLRSRSFVRERRRKAFVAEAEAGKIEGYRVDTTDDAKVLVRVSHEGDAYRGAERAEEVYREDVGGTLAAQMKR